MVKAKDVMTRNVITVKADTPVEVIIKILTVRKLTGIPVVDDDNTLLGIVTEKDLLGLLFKHENLENMKAEDYMTRDVESFDVEDSLEDVCTLLLDKTFRRVTVVSDGKLMGIVSRTDIIAYIYRELVKKKS
ncbi:MAG: CBS domain-containing protein [Candidatus Omnitrophica bacterium]|nr:CBS domain-containing protein [Candidatus Omnitrophota bacterium]MBU1997712.1 CBS domain-containing protein [Candidatus Omnitrophota bacterium]MBU4333971.1 CBS domain-containing protein [Candidatus Omnitrophota bacterium]